MNDLIAFILFSSLTIIFFTGIFIIVGNEIKIRNFSNMIKKRLKQQNHARRATIKIDLQNKLIPLIPQPTFQIPEILNTKLLPLLIQSKTVA
jgi:hypothetical protein